MDWKSAALLGLGLNSIGVIALFLFGMPFRLGLGDHDVVTVNIKDPRKTRLDSCYRFLGYLALLMALLGAALQAYSIGIAP